MRGSGVGVDEDVEAVGWEEEEEEEVIESREALKPAMKRRCSAVVSGERYTAAEKSSGPLRVLVETNEDE